MDWAPGPRQTRGGHHPSSLREVPDLDSGFGGHGGLHHGQPRHRGGHDGGRRPLCDPSELRGRGGPGPGLAGRGGGREEAGPGPGERCGGGGANL